MSASPPSVDTFRLLVEQSPFGIYIVNADFKLVQVSQGAQKVFSQVRPLLGRDFAEVLRLIWPEPFASEAIGHFRRTLETGEAYHAPRTVEPRRDIAATEAYDWKIERLVLPDGRFGAVCHFYDLSDRMAGERAVRESEERLALGVQAAGLALAHVDYDADTFQLTAEAARAYGLGDGPMSVSRQAIHASFHPDDRAEVERRIAQSLDPRGDGSLAVDHRVVHPNGTERWLRVRKQVAFQGSGDARRPMSATLAALDITPEREAAEALRKSEARLAASAAELDALYQTAPAGLCVIDRELRYVRINAHLAEMNGVPIAQTLGRHVWEVVPDLPEIVTHFRRILATGVSFRGEISGSTRATPEVSRSWLVSYEPVRGADGSIVAVSAMAFETTEQRAAERRLEAAQRMETAGRIAGGVAHEANNQMTIVLGSVSFLEEEQALGETGREDLEHIKRAAERTSAICKQLLAFSRRQVLNRVELVPDEVTRAMATLMSRTLGDRSRLEFQLDASSVAVRTDRGQLEQALLNLALNARDAMPGGGTLTLGSALVDISHREVRRLGMSVEPGRYWQLAVRDTGTGMDAATRARIFEPFFTTKPVGQGTGLGLSMVQGVVRQSGGDLVVESALGAGTTVRLFLPVIAEQGTSASAPRNVALPVGTGEVLLVDDEPTLLRVAARALRTAGFAVLTAQNGELALALLQERNAPPTCLVSDVMMPGLSGVELVHRVRQRWPAVPVVLMSGHTELGPELPGASRTAFLSKPFTPADLVRCVASLIGGSS